MSWDKKTVAKRMKRSSQLNQELFWDYYNQLSEQGKDLNTVPSALSRVIEDTGHKDINLLEIEDIKTALMNLAPTTINARVNFLKTFLKFAAAKVTLQFDINDLDDLKVNQREVEASKEDKWEALSVDDVIALRLKLRELKKYRPLYYFEMFYAFGLEMDELINLHSGNYDEKEKKFRFQGNEYTLPAQLHDIPHDKLIPKKKFGNTTPTYNLSHIEKFFGRKVSRGDIIATRSQTFFKCPKCGDMYEATPENWVVFHYEIDNSKWIVCRKKCLEEENK